MSSPSLCTVAATIDLHVVPATLAENSQTWHEREVQKVRKRKQQRGQTVNERRRSNEVRETRDGDGNGESMCGFSELKSKDALLRGELSVKSGYRVISSVLQLCMSPCAGLHNSVVYSGESAMK